MKKILFPAIAVLIVICTVLGCGWYYNARSDNAQKNTAQQEAAEAYGCFVRFRETGDEKYYSYAVSSFYRFEQTYCLYDDRYYPTTNTVYALLVEKPEDCRAHFDELLDAMEILSGDVTHPNGYGKLAHFMNAVQEG